MVQALRKNLGKNCELSPDDIQRICDTYLASKETEPSKIFANAAFGYCKVTVERPLRLHSQLTQMAIESLRFASGDEDLRAELYEVLGEPLFADFARIRPELEQLLAELGSDEQEGDDAPAKKSLPETKKKKLLDPKTWDRDAKLVEVANAPRADLGDGIFENHNIFRDRVDAALDARDLKLSAADRKLILRAVSWRVENAPPVVAKVHKPGKAQADPLHGLYEAEVGGKKCVVEYEPDADLRDTEQVPLLEPGRIEAFIHSEVLPYATDAWIDESKTEIGYEISFTRHFYKPHPFRTLEEIRAEILALEKETEGLLSGIVREVAK
jgi:type I restriction enzyme M protein